MKMPNFGLNLRLVLRANASPANAMHPAAVPYRTNASSGRPIQDE